MTVIMLSIYIRRLLSASFYLISNSMKSINKMLELRDNVSRTKAPSSIGESIFIGLHAADVFWQYNLLHRSWGISIIGGRRWVVGTRH